MKITTYEKNIIRVKTGFGSIAIQDCEEVKTKNKRIIIAINVPHGIKIEGIGTRITVLKKED